MKYTCSKKTGKGEGGRVENRWVKALEGVPSLKAGRGVTMSGLLQRTKPCLMGDFMK